EEEGEIARPRVRYAARSRHRLVGALDVRGWAAGGKGVLEQEILRAEIRCGRVAKRHELPVRAKAAGSGGIPKVGGENRVPQILPQPRVGDRAEDLDTAIEIALHEIGAADEELRRSTVLEIENPRMLEEPADNRSHGNAFAHAGDAGSQAAH